MRTLPPRRAAGRLVPLLAPILLALAAAPAPRDAPAADRDAVRARAAEILADRALQTEMPSPEPPPGPAPFQVAIPPAVGWILLAVLLGAVGVAALLAWSDRLPRPGGGKIGPPPRPVAETEEDDREAPSRPRGDPDELARAGAYGEAVHLLLLRALEALEREPRGRRLPPSWTPRRLVARLGLAGERGEALADLVHGAELHVFAGRALTREDWERCRAAYDTLTAVPEAA